MQQRGFAIKGFFGVAIGMLVWTTGCVDSGQVFHHGQYAETVRELGGELQVHLEFGAAAITDDDLASLEFPDTVRSISFRDTGVTDRGVEELQRAANLEWLDLGNTQITDASIEHLKGLPRLCDVVVTSRNVSRQANGELRQFMASRDAAPQNRSMRAAVPRLPVSRP